MRPHLAYMPALRYAPAYRPSGEVTPSASQILELQEALAFRGLLPNTAAGVDGRLGTNTRTALRLFQTQEGLDSTGQLDNTTLARLIAVRNEARAAGFTRGTFSGAGPAVATAAQAGGKMGVNPAVGSIVTKDATGAATGVVTIPEKVAGTISPQVAEQLSKMPPAAAQSFVNDLSNKASQAEATGQTVQNATPVVQPNGTVTAAVVTAPAGWWASQSDNAKAAWIAGGALGAVAVVSLIVYATSGK